MQPATNEENACILHGWKTAVEVLQVKQSWHLPLQVAMATTLRSAAPLLANDNTCKIDHATRKDDCYCEAVEQMLLEVPTKYSSACWLRGEVVAGGNKDSGSIKEETC
ncbi:uncharacterized protein PAC_09847 [Phialocephala subalpina]|uniref:Uncharacterized protein n=1 Tax=Phialocephala subalpina TaxID=576137 RepID=A0A1L7X4M7_9HELO|nr:uncharacterized protein PAC_09847 [Phialocephala subalpina]